MGDELSTLKVARIKNTCFTLEREMLSTAERCLTLLDFAKGAVEKYGKTRFPLSFS